MPNTFTDIIADSMSKDTEALDTSVLRKPVYSENDILKNLGYAAYQFESASNFLIKYTAQIDKRRAKIRTKILSRSVELIENTQLRIHLIAIFENEKLKLTKDDIDGFVVIELGDLFEQLSRAELLMKSAEKAHDMWQRQLSWYQSVLKRETAELMALGMQKG